MAHFFLPFSFLPNFLPFFPSSSFFSFLPLPPSFLPPPPWFPQIQKGLEERRKWKSFVNKMQQPGQSDITLPGQSDVTLPTSSFSWRPIQSAWLSGPSISGGSLQILALSPFSKTWGLMSFLWVQHRALTAKLLAGFPGKHCRNV